MVVVVVVDVVVVVVGGGGGDGVVVGVDVELCVFECVRLCVHASSVCVICVRPSILAILFFIFHFCLFSALFFHCCFLNWLGFSEAE